MVVSFWQRRMIELYTMLTAAEYYRDARRSCLRSLAYNGCSGEDLFSPCMTRYILEQRCGVAYPFCADRPLPLGSLQRAISLERNPTRGNIEVTLDNR